MIYELFACAEYCSSNGRRSRLVKMCCMQCHFMKTEQKVNKLQLKKMMMRFKEIMSD